MPLDARALAVSDREFLLHSQHAPSADDPVIIEEGKGIRVRDVSGAWYIDGHSALWNVNLGHGRRDLVDAATKQMTRLAFASTYKGRSNVPAIELAARLAKLAYPRLKATFFTSCGATANESAFKTARYYWRRKGTPSKIKIISRRYGYHGVTMAAMSATGIDDFWKMFQPLMPDFSHIPSPYPYRFEGARPGESIGAAAARALEEEIVRLGADTVAAFIAEPVQGAGGIIVPPDDYFPRIRKICDQYGVLLISDEVITGFGRTGRWFALDHWGIEPDIMTFAKGITSGYLPLGGMMISEEICEAFKSAPPDEAWMHASTYSGHPVCCAVALRTLDAIEEERLVERVAQIGPYLLERMGTLRDLEAVGDVRGLGLLVGVELVADRATKKKFPAEDKVGERVRGVAKRLGLIHGIKGDILNFAPPFTINEDEIDQMVAIVREAIQAITRHA